MIINGMRKPKAQLNLGLDVYILEEFDKICSMRGLKKSQIIENLIKRYLDESKIENAPPVPISNSATSTPVVHLSK